MWARLSLTVKLTTLTVSMVSIASFSFVNFASNGLLTMMGNAAGYGTVTAAVGLASMIDGEWFSQVDATKDVDPVKSNLERRLTALLGKGQIDRVYLIRYSGPDQIEHVLNLPVDGTIDYYDVGQVEKIDPYTTPYVHTPISHGPFELSKPGTFVAGWAPIIYNDQSVGVLLVVVDGTEMQNFISTISATLLVVMLVLILLSGMIAYKFAAGFEKSAVTDGLMGIYNHKYFKQRLEAEVAKAARYAQSTSLVLLDIDYFKRVNDTYGHATGDLVLKNLARWVMDSVRTTDVAARYGGEEVAIILPHTSIAGAQEFAERLRHKISHQIISDPAEDAEFRVTISVGVTQWEKGVTMLDMIKRADAALYQSKENGRNRVTIYQDQLLIDSAPTAQNVKVAR